MTKREREPLVFERQRSKELLAYLIALRGSAASRENICSVLFEDIIPEDHWVTNFMNTLPQK